jgi:hypothetical protein
MKRFSRPQIILALTAVILLALSIVFIIGYFNADSKTAKLKKDIVTKQTQINNLATCDINDKITQLDECMNKLATQSPFPAQSYDSAEVMNAIIGVVADARVQLETLDHTGQGGMQLGATTYSVGNYHLQCSTDEGKGKNLIVLLELFEELREEKYNTLLVSNVQLPTGRTQISFDIRIVTQ